MSETVTTLVEYLTEEEEQQLDKYEATVIGLSNNVLESARKVGEILEQIRRTRIWSKARRTSDKVYIDFAEYAKDKFGKGKTMSYNYVAIYNIMNEMEKAGIDP